ncbi:MAG: NAD(P)/FAD-dependent oxidoreductase [Thermodesulfobacteriota bacterium]|nr:NAD(P)/FAD-dependent oxidoreductase [Thermodesulfobacteriota bacterium]
MYDAVIIGAGYGGMSAGALLADAGLRVVVLEKASCLGGRAASFRDDSGYMWEYGAHSLRLAHKGLAAEVFGRLGLEIAFVPEANDAKLIFKGRLWDRPEGPAGFLLTRILPFKSRINLLRLILRLKRGNPLSCYDKTLLDFCREGFDDKTLEGFLPFLGLMIMYPDPARVSAGEVMQFIQRFFAAGIGVGEPVGGTAQIFKGLQRHVDVHLDEKAESVITENGHVMAVKTSKKTYKARRVIFAARLPLLFEIMDRGLFSRGFAEYVDHIENSSGLSIDFITDQRVSDIRGGVLGVDIPIWAKFQSNTDPTLTPEGRFLSTWGIMLPSDFGPDEIEAAESRLKDTIRALFPGFFDHVVKQRRLVVPVMNGTLLKASQSLPHRPGVVCDTVQGLFFAGDTAAGIGCSGDIAFSSAMKVADAILK